MPIITSTVVLVGLYSGLALLIAGSDGVAFDTLPLAAAVAGALLLSTIVFWPDGGGASSAGSGEVRRQPELLAFVAFATRTHEWADNPHRTRAGSEALAAGLRERLEVAANHPVRLVWPEQWINAPVNRMRPGMEAGVMLRRRAVAALRRDGTPEPVADRLCEDGDAWPFLGIGDVTALARIHTERKVEIADRDRAGGVRLCFRDGGAVSGGREVGVPGPGRVRPSAALRRYPRHPARRGPGGHRRRHPS